MRKAFQAEGRPSKKQVHLYNGRWTKAVRGREMESGVGRVGRGGVG